MLLGFILVSGCGAPKRPLVTDLVASQDLSSFKLDSLRGTRDGDRLDVRAMFTDTSSMLTVNLRFEINPEARLRAGNWQANRNNALTTGTATAKSIDFLGGQSGAPSIGGTFDLATADGTAQYRVRIPLTELKQRLTK